MSKHMRFVNIILIIIISSHLPAQDHQAVAKEIEQSQSQAKRSTIVEADGYAFIAEDKTIAQLREQALANAKREALERAETYIESLVTVENYQVTYDLIQSKAEGKLKILESKDYGIQSDNRYRYWIKTEVEYSLKKPETAGKAEMESMFNAKGPLTVQVWTEKTEFKQGEEMIVFIQGNKDFYARIIYQDAAGSIVQLLPNQYRQDNFFKADVTYRIPDDKQGDRFALSVSPPFGSELIVVYASTAAPGDVELGEAQNGIKTYSGDLSSLGRLTRGIKIIPAQGKATAAEFYEARMKMITKP